MTFYIFCQTDSSTQNSSRRNSLLSSLIKRGDDQLMSRLMSLQKNVEWLPIRIHIPLAAGGGQSVGRSIASDQIQMIESANNSIIHSKDLVAIKQQLMQCLIRYRDLLDYKSMLKRYG